MVDRSAILLAGSLALAPDCRDGASLPDNSEVASQSLQAQWSGRGGRSTFEEKVKGLFWMC